MKKCFFSLEMNLLFVLEYEKNINKTNKNNNE
jgi:hypothetical protein